MSFNCIPLSQLCTDISYGYTASATNKNTGTKFLRITDIQGGVVDWENVPFCEITKNNFLKNELKKGDIVIARTGNSTGENYFFDYHDDTVFASYLIRFRVNTQLANPYFVWLQLRTTKWSNFIKESKSGSAQTGINAKTLSKFETYIPEKSIQDKVSNFFLKLNKKIQLNTQINRTLEAIAQALFKSWFVDFEPVKAKAAVRANGGSSAEAERAAMRVISGKSNNELDDMASQHPDDYAQLAHTASLFPDTLVDSELGEIPEGWKIGKIKDLCKVQGGFAYKSKDFLDSGHPVVKIKDISSNRTINLIENQCINDELAKITSKFQLNDGELLMAMTGATVGKFGLINTYGKRVFVNQRVARFIDNKFNNISFYLYCLFNIDKYYDSIIFAAQGSAQANISSSAIENITTIVPNESIIFLYLSLSRVFFNKILKNNTQNQTLATLRDTLLPKLLSGELDVSHLLPEEDA